MSEIVWGNFPHDLWRPTASAPGLLVRQGQLWRILGRRRLPKALCCDGSLIAFAFCPCAPSTLGRKFFLRRSEGFLDLPFLGVDAARHFVFRKMFVAELCLKIVDGIARVRQCPLGLLARSRLLPKGLAGGFQLLQA